MLRMFIAVVFLSSQVLLVLSAQCSEARWFSWAPHTAQVRYSIRVEVDGRPLGLDAIGRRYGIPADGWEAHAIQNVKDLVMQHTRTHGRDERATIVMHYSVNGAPEEAWVWRSEPDR